LKVSGSRWHIRHFRERHFRLDGGEIPFDPIAPILPGGVEIAENVALIFLRRHVFHS